MRRRLRGGGDRYPHRGHGGGWRPTPIRAHASSSRDYGHLSTRSTTVTLLRPDQGTPSASTRSPLCRPPCSLSRVDASPRRSRYLMIWVIATASNPRFVSRVDIDRGGTTYTIDTPADLSREYPDSITSLRVPTRWRRRGRTPISSLSRRTHRRDAPRAQPVGLWSAA